MFVFWEKLIFHTFSVSYFEIYWPLVAIHNVGAVFFSQKRKKNVPILSWIIISWWLMCNRWLLFRLCETIKCCGCVPLVPTNEHLPFLLSSKPITWPAFYCLWCQFPLTVLEFNHFYLTKTVITWLNNWNIFNLLLKVQKFKKNLTLSFEAMYWVFLKKS